MSTDRTLDSLAPQNPDDGFELTMSASPLLRNMDISIVETITEAGAIKHETIMGANQNTFDALDHNNDEEFAAETRDVASTGPPERIATGPEIRDDAAASGMGADSEFADLLLGAPNTGTITANEDETAVDASSLCTDYLYELLVIFFCLVALFFSATTKKKMDASWATFLNTFFSMALANFSTRVAEVSTSQVKCLLLTASFSAATMLISMCAAGGLMENFSNLTASLGALAAFVHACLPDWNDNEYVIEGDFPLFTVPIEDILGYMFTCTVTPWKFKMGKNESLTLEVGSIFGWMVVIMEAENLAFMLYSFFQYGNHVSANTLFLSVICQLGLMILRWHISSYLFSGYFPDTKKAYAWMLRWIMALFAHMAIQFGIQFLANNDSGSDNNEDSFFHENTMTASIIVAAMWFQILLFAFAQEKYGREQFFEIIRGNGIDTEGE